MLLSPTHDLRPNFVAPLARRRLTWCPPLPPSPLPSCEPALTHQPRDLRDPQWPMANRAYRNFQGMKEISSM
jgi:hypothetical protein